VKINVTVRLIELVDAWQGCLALAAYLSDPAQTPSADIRAAATQIGPKPMHTDPAIALLSALAAIVAMGICAFFWIATAWPEGAGAIAFAAVSCTLFASLDDSAPANASTPTGDAKRLGAGRKRRRVFSSCRMWSVWLDLDGGLGGEAKETALFLTIIRQILAQPQERYRRLRHLHAHLRFRHFLHPPAPAGWPGRTSD
jgi:hypothetical protein